MKKYIIAIGDASDLIPNIEHIERNDALCEELGITDHYSDFDASCDAKTDGVKLIGDMEGIYNNFYVDTTKNREIIKDYLKENVFIEEKNNTRYERINN